MNFPSALQRLRIYTDQNDKYEELTEENRTFNRKTELFVAALVIGIVNNRKSQNKPKKTNILDFIKLPPETQELIYLLFEVTKNPQDIQTSCTDLLRFADSGIESIWQAYQDQGTLDLTRLVEETKEKWPRRMEKLGIVKQQAKINKIIGERESSNIEYKSSMLWDYDAQKENRKLLGGVIAKTVASFMNVNGGLLLIGVRDDKQILGIERDLKVLSDHTEDRFAQHFTNIIEKHLKIENALNVNIRFETVEGKTIAVVEVPERAPKPVYYQKPDHEEIFYIRANNTSRQLPTSQIADYIKEHWPELH